MEDRGLSLVQTNVDETIRSLRVMTGEITVIMYLKDSLEVWCDFNVSWVGFHG